MEYYITWGMVIMLQQQTCVVISVVVRVAFKGQRRRVVAQSHEEDDDCAQDHHRSHQEEAEAVHGARDATPVILLLIVVVLVAHVFDDVVGSVHGWFDFRVKLIRLSSVHWRLRHCCVCGAGHQSVSDRLLLEHELAAGLDAVVFLSFSDVPHRAGPTRQSAVPVRLRLLWFGHVQDLGQVLQEKPFGPLAHNMSAGCSEVQIKDNHAVQHHHCDQHHDEHEILDD